MFLEKYEIFFLSKIENNMLISNKIIWRKMYIMPKLHKAVANNN